MGKPGSCLAVRRVRPGFSRTVTYSSDFGVDEAGVGCEFEVGVACT